MSRKNSNLCNEMEMSFLEFYTDDLLNISSDNDCNSISDSEDNMHDEDLENFEGSIQNSDSDDEIVVHKCKTMQLNLSSSDSEESEKEDI